VIGTVTPVVYAADTENIKMDLKVAESQSHDDKRVPGFLQDQFGVCRRAIWVQEGREPMVEPVNVGRFSGSVLESRKSRGLGQVEYFTLTHTFPWTPRRLLGVSVDSSESPHGVHEDSIVHFLLVPNSLHGLCVEYM
jgi:hypothetical protein